VDLLDQLEIAAFEEMAQEMSFDFKLPGGTCLNGIALTGKPIIVTYSFPAAEDAGSNSTSGSR